MWVKRLNATLVAFIALGGLADPVRAQDGVFIDPGSPSGKEYEIPLETVRRGAEPGSDPSAPITQGERSTVPFGAGISGDTGERGSAGAGSSSGPEGNYARSGKGGDRAVDGDWSRETVDSGATAGIVEAAANNPGAPPASTSGTLLYLGAGALVLALGAAGGLLLRNRRS